MIPERKLGQLGHARDVGFCIGMTVGHMRPWASQASNL